MYNKRATGKQVYSTGSSAQCSVMAYWGGVAGMGEGGSWGRGYMCNWSWFGEGNGTPLQYSCLENPMDGGAWWAAVHGVSKSQTRLSDFTFTFHFHALKEEMATHSSVLAWRIPGTGEPGGLSSLGSHRVGHDWSDLAAAAELIHIAVQQRPAQHCKVIILQLKIN